MSLPLLLACLWAVVANVLAILPSADNHWRNAYVLIAFGIPVLGLVTAEHGPWVGLLVLAGGCSVLRWPLVHFGRWLRNVAARGVSE
jgi:hypothetical protein